jgi:hypothetical protein
MMIIHWVLGVPYSQTVGQISEGSTHLSRCTGAFSLPRSTAGGFSRCLLVYHWRVYHCHSDLHSYPGSPIYYLRCSHLFPTRSRDFPNFDQPSSRNQKQQHQLLNWSSVTSNGCWLAGHDEPWWLGLDEGSERFGAMVVSCCIHILYLNGEPVLRVS